MAENSPIRKLIQLILDRAAARRMEGDAKKSLGVVDQGLKALKSMAMAVGGALAGIFVGRRILQFGRESVQAARESEVAWTRLGGAIENAGGSADDLMPRLRSMAEAFEDATVHDDDAFAVGLQRLITLTGDVDASINNMGLAANVAAQYFDGQLEPAIELVGRAMNGQTRLLRQLGIDTKDAQQALDTVAERSMGAASRELTTQAGKAQQTANAWGNFKEEIGFAMSETEGAISVFDVLIGTIRAMTRWVADNVEGISFWVTGSLKVAVVTVDALYRSIRGLGEIIVGSFLTTIGAAVRGVNFFAQAFGNVLEVIQKVSNFLGMDTITQNVDNFLTKLRERTTAIENWALAAGEVGLDTFKAGAGRFARSNLDTGRQAPDPNALGNNRPRVSRFTRNPEAEREAEQALNKAREEALKITEQVMTKQEEYDATILKLNEHLQAGRITQETYNRAVAAAQDDLEGTSESAKRAQEEAVEITRNARDASQVYSDTLADLQEHLDAGRISQETFNAAAAEAKRVFDEAAAAADPVGTILKDHAHAMETSATLAQVLGSQYAALEQEEASLLQTMRDLADAGVGPLDERMVGLADRLGQVQEGMRKVQEEAELTGAIASAVGDVVAAAMSGELPALARAKARQNAILAAEQLAHAAAAAAGLFTAGTVPQHLAAAAKYAAIAAAWGGFGAVIGGGSSGGGGLAGGRPRDVGGRRSERMQPAGPELHVHFVGPGFNALNPQVQQIAYGAYNEYASNLGPNAKVRLHRTPG